MQTTLLGLAIAIILALVTALVGPLLIDWNGYREQLEARASGLTGLEFKVAGAIDARLLPTPSLTLQGIEFGRPRDASRVRARSLRLEFALGSLLRGEWKVSDARLEAPEVSIALDAAGHIGLPVPSTGFAPDGVSIQQLSIEGGRVILADASTQSRLVLEKLEFRGDLRSLAGPAKGEGSFVIAGQHYPYRFSAGRVADDGSLKMRLALDPIERPFTAEADVSIRIENGVPQFEGGVAVARVVGRAPEGAQALILEPWRVTSRIKGDSNGASLDQFELQYGPDERPIKIRGGARMVFGAKPRLDGELSSPQIDVDRILSLTEPNRRRPLPVLKTFADYVANDLHLPFPVRLGVQVESLTLAGAPLQRLNGVIKSDGESWDIERLELRAPGLTQVRLGGRIGVTRFGTVFRGPVEVDAGNPRALLSWLTGRTEEQVAVAGPLRVAGAFTLGKDQVAVDALKADVDRMTLAGRLSYRWGSEGYPARIDGALTASEVDLDRIRALGSAIFDDASFDWPRQGSLSLNVARAMVAGVDARQVDVDVRIDGSGVDINRLTVADFGGAALAVKGRVGTEAQSPRGTITLDLNARSLDGINTAIAKFSPEVAEQLRRYAPQLSPATLRATLAVDPVAVKSANPTVAAQFKADGRAGPFRLALQGDATAATRAFTVQHVEQLKSASVKMSARIEADDARLLVDLAKLDDVLAVEKRPGRLTFSADGPLDGKLAVDAQLTTGVVNVSVNGTATLPGKASPTASLAFKMANAGLRSLRPGASGRPAEAVPATVSGKLTLADDAIALTEIAGNVANMGIAGRLTIGLAQPQKIDGDFELGGLDVPAALAAVLGMPGTTTDLWPSEPFDAGLIRGHAGEIRIKSARAMLVPKLLAREFRATVRFDERGVALQDVDGEVAGGRMTAEFTALRGAEGLATRGHVRFAAANAAELLPGDGAFGGQITLDLTAEGSGRSASALIGSLTGNGSFTLQNGTIERLDPAVFDALTRAVDGGLPMDAVRVRGWLDKALAARALPVSLAEGSIILTAGQVRLGNMVVHADGAELTAGGSFSLIDAGLDARVLLVGAPGMGGVANARPEITINLKGSVAAPKRTIDVAALSSWLALRSVEQQSKKLELLEQAKKLESPEGTAPTDARSDNPPVVAPIVPVAPTRPAPAATAAVPPAPAQRQSNPSPAPAPRQSAPLPAAPHPERTSPVVRAEPEAQQGAKPAPRPAATQKPPSPPPPPPRPAPPPINLLPFFGPRT